MTLWWRRLTARRSDAKRGATVRPSEYVSAVQRYDRTVLLDLRSERYLGLDEVGGAIWACVEAGLGEAEIVARLEAEYDAPTAQIAADVAAFLDRLHAARLVVAA
jgi:hypothetical protein